MARRFRGTVTLEGTESSDHRVLELVTWRDLPLTLRVQTEDFGAHDGASPVGRMDTLVKADGGRVEVDGVFSDTEPGLLAETWVAEGVLRGVSVDPGAIEYVEELVDPATGETVSMEQVYETWDLIEAADITGDEAEAARLMEWLESLYYRVRFTTYEIAAATLVATPAFPEAVIEVYDGEAPAQPQDGQAATAGEPAPQAAASTIRDRLAALTPAGSGATVRQRLAALRPGHQPQAPEVPVGRMVASGTRRYQPDAEPAPVVVPTEAEAEVRQAAASRLAVVTFPGSVFDAEPLTGPTKWTIERDGRFHGHLFTWDQCHRSNPNRCETPGFFRADVEAGARDFHVGDAHLEEGGVARVGVLTFADLHAPGGRLSAAQLTKLMEDTGCQLGPARLHSDQFGLQACGKLWDDVDPTAAGRCLAGFPSYDARMIGGRWRLFGLHVVNTPGHTMVEEHDGAPVRMVASVSPNMAACDCGGTCGGCSGHDGTGEALSGRSRGLSAQRLADLAALDAAHRLREPSRV